MKLWINIIGLFKIKIKQINAKWSFLIKSVYNNNNITFNFIYILLILIIIDFRIYIYPSDYSIIYFLIQNN